MVPFAFVNVCKDGLKLRVRATNVSENIPGKNAEFTGKREGDCNLVICSDKTRVISDLRLNIGSEHTTYFNEKRLAGM
jgi:hypothetical protein